MEKTLNIISAVKEQYNGKSRVAALFSERDWLRSNLVCGGPQRRSAGICSCGPHTSLDKVQIR